MSARAGPRHHAAPDTDVLRQRLAKLAPLQPVTPRQISLQRLAGLSHAVYRVDAGRRRFVLKVGDARSAPGEQHSAGLAAAAGLAPPVLWCDPRAGLTLFSCLPGRALTRADLRDPGILRRALDLLRALHRSDCGFATRLVPTAAFERYLADLGVAPAVHAEPLHARLAALRERVEAQSPDPPPVRLCPCHVDPTPANFFDDGTRLWLLDWEFAAIADPLWDLAYLALECAAGRDAQVAMLRHYHARDASRSAAALRAMCLRVQLVNAAWSALQLVRGNPNADFAADALRRCGELDDALQRA